MTSQQRAIEVNKEVVRLRNNLNLQIVDLDSTRRDLLTREEELKILSRDEASFGNQAPMSEVASRWPTLNNTSFQKIAVRLNFPVKV